MTFSRLEAEQLEDNESEDSGSRRKSMTSRRASKAPILEKSGTRETDEMKNVDSDDFLEIPLIEILMK